MTTDREPLSLVADVLVLGGGPAGTWAAVAAAATGASVVLADKGYCGTSGATASGGNNLWHIPPGPARDAAVAARENAGGFLTDARWMHRVLDETYRRVDLLGEWGYPFPLDEAGAPRRSSLQGPEYMRRMRRKVHRSGVRILDHSPALELLADADGVVSGAAGVQRQDDSRPWSVRAGAVVIATGGCAFLSGAFGTNVDTGDGQLMAAELGAQLSGMEFSNAYAMAPAFSGHTKGLMMQFASYYDEAGDPIEVASRIAAREEIAFRLLEGRQVFAKLDAAPADLRGPAQHAQPNYFLPLQKFGVDPFTDAYPVRLVFEGTVRGTGGLRIVDDECATTVPGLYAAGDAATRELITGAISGGGSHNGAWAISSGTWAGTGAAAFARRRHLPSRLDVRAAGRAGLRPDASPGSGPTAAEVVADVQSHLLPIDRGYFRTGAVLQRSAAELDGIWRLVAGSLSGSGRAVIRAREAAALVANARWAINSALVRTESRGLHRRTDFPDTESTHVVRILSGGVDNVWTALDDVAPVPSSAARAGATA